MAARCACSPGEEIDARFRRAQGTSRSSPARRSTGGCARSSAASRARLRVRSRRVRLGPLVHVRVLHELRVENLLLMERAELRLAPGLNVLTGETGAGKTLLAHALDLLLGGRRAQRDRPRRAPPRHTSKASSRCRASWRRRADPRRRRGAGARAARVARRADPRVRLRARGDGRRPARARRQVAGVLRPARAPQADALGRAARDPRRLLRSRAG